MQKMRGVREWCALVALAGVVGACETARNPGGVLRDQIPPTITLVAASDTQQISNGLSFTVAATDNLGLKDVRLTYSDPSIAQSDSIFTSAVTTFTASSPSDAARTSKPSLANLVVRIFWRNLSSSTITIFSFAPSSGIDVPSGAFRSPDRAACAAEPSGGPKVSPLSPRNP